MTDRGGDAMRSMFSPGVLSVLVVATGIGGCTGVDFGHP